MQEGLFLNNLRIKYEIISVGRLSELQKDIEKTEQDGNLSKIDDRSGKNGLECYVDDNIIRKRYLHKNLGSL